MGENKVDLRKLNILGGIGLLIFGLKILFSFFSLVGLILEAIVIYKYSKILKNPKIWRFYLLYLIGLCINGLILFSITKSPDIFAKINTNLIFGLISLVIVIMMLFYQIAYINLGLSIGHNYFTKILHYVIAATILTAVVIFSNPNNPYVIAAGVYLGQFGISLMFAIGYFTAPKEIYLEEKKDE
jgi:hypothetical protein